MEAGPAEVLEACFLAGGIGGLEVIFLRQLEDGRGRLRSLLRVVWQAEGAILEATPKQCGCIAFFSNTYCTAGEKYIVLCSRLYSLGGFVDADYFKLALCGDDMTTCLQRTVQAAAAKILDKERVAYLPGGAKSGSMCNDEKKNYLLLVLIFAFSQ